MPPVELDLKSIAVGGEARHYPFVYGVEAERLDINPKKVASSRNRRHPKHALIIEILRRAAFGFKIGKRDPMNAEAWY